MYIRTVKSRDKGYVQLAHNFRDPKTGVSKAKILYSFGRKDQLDVEGLERFAVFFARGFSPKLQTFFPSIACPFSS
jgi:hypothetical protein